MRYSSPQVLVLNSLVAVASSKIQTELPGELTKRGQLPASAAARAACSALLHCYLSRASSSKSTHIPILRRAIHTRIIKSALTHFYSNLFSY